MGSERQAACTAPAASQAHRAPGNVRWVSAREEACPVPWMKQTDEAVQDFSLWEIGGKHGQPWCHLLDTQENFLYISVIRIRCEHQREELTRGLAHRGPSGNLCTIKKKKYEIMEKVRNQETQFLAP